VFTSPSEFLYKEKKEGKKKLTSCAALIQGGIRLYVPEIPDDNCPPANCNETGCFNAYTKEGGYPGEPSWKCRAGADLFLETCKLMARLDVGVGGC
jgi:hypothetical protein